ncbi:MAG: LacI family DNA-binding transcriptional regulator [Anaerolineales bacterium]|nr:LacI family DNA-binding transcriptional regulator [Anaerolineales bacterium]
MATIRDVARKAKVHPSTVSRVFSGKASISEATRKRVLSAAENLGFQPNAIARSLKTQKTHTIGMVVPHVFEGFFDDSFFPQIMRGMLEAAYQHHFRLIVSGSQGYTDEISQIKDIMRSSQADGIVVMSSRLDVDTVDRLLELDTPFVLIGHPPKENHHQISWVDADNQIATRKAIQHLINLGHKQIAYVGGDPKNLTTRERQQAYEDTMRASGLAIEPNWIDYGYFDEPGGYTAVQRMKTLGNNAPTAYYAANDLMAVGILRALTELGRCVPEEVSVMGTNNSYLSQHTTPALTTVDVPYAEIGKKAVELLITQVTNLNKTPSSYLEDCHLVLRSSTGPVASSNQPDQSGRSH